MKIQDILSDKVILINLTSITISFANIEMILKLMLLCTSIVYTIMKIIELYQKKYKKDD
jgi:hypothetical protein